MAARLHWSDAKSTAVRKRIENHKFEDEEGDEYAASNFGGFTDYFRRKKIKLQNLDAELRAASNDCPPIFRGVVAHVNGYTQPSLNDLHKLIVSHGGGFQQYLDGKTAVTHIIAANLTPKKRVEFRRYRIVKPAWVVESIAARRLLPWDDFRIIDEGKGQKVLGFDGGYIINQKNDFERGYREQTDGSWYTSQVKGMANDVNDGFDDAPVSSRRPPSLEQSDARANEVITSEVKDEPNTEAPDHAGKSSLDDVSRAIADAEADPDFGKDLSFSVKNEGTDWSQTADRTAPEIAGLESDSGGERPSTVRPDDRDAEPTADFPFTTHKGTVAQQRPQPTASPSKRARSSRSDSPIKRPKMSAEEHNAILLADPRMRKSSVLNPDFLQQYYSESRLHHLSTWKAALKLQVQQLTAEKSSPQKKRERRPTGSRRYVLHVDFDSFFAAVSLKNSPELKDKPVVVAHGSGTGSEIASCNYVARRSGVKNGMWMKRALELCPEVQVLPYDFKAYEEASRHFYDAILAVGGIIQSVSIDEALVDVSSLCLPAGGSEGKGVSEGSIWREQAKADEIAQGLRALVLEKTGCAVSVGIGGSILLAKVALRKAKPAGQYHLMPEEVLDFIGELTVQDLPGVAHSIGGKLEDLGVTFVKDVRSLSREKLMTALGPKTGEKIWDYARGIDRTEVGEHVLRKSVSAEVNWGVRFETQEQAEDFICSLCAELQKRLLEQKVKGRQLTMKIMRRAADAPLDPPKHLGHGKCDTFNKSVVLGVATNAAEVLQREALSILKGYGFSPGELRGLGVQMTRLEPLKSLGGGVSVESSQKKLQFKTPDLVPRVKEEDRPDPITNDPVTPRKPTKQRNGPLLKTPESGSKSAFKRLNTLGTQFVVPSQLDPSVLAELPEDIRSKLVAPRATSHAPMAMTPTRSRGDSPLSSDSSLLNAALPNHSQLDPETLAALPSDVRAEILALYSNHASPHKAQPQQSLLPQSPRKIRPIISSRKSVTPSKRRIRNALAATTSSTTNTLTQSNFLPLPPSNPSSPPSDNLDSDPDPDPTFLAALPPDIRGELLSEQKRARLEALHLSRPSRTHPPLLDPLAEPQIQRFLRLPSPPSKPTFTSHGISELPQLRDVVTTWVKEFENEDGGPYAEDVDALAVYLEQVVGEERDMEKAVAVVRWLRWVVGEVDSGKSGKAGWEATRARVEERVRRAVRGRGGGEVVL